MALNIPTRPHRTEAPALPKVNTPDNHIPAFNFDFPRKIVELFWVKTRENAAVLDFLAVDKFDFTRKIVKKILGEKLVKMLGICTF